MRAILFGLGNYYGRFRKYFDDEDIVVLCDNNKEQHGKIIDGLDYFNTFFPTQN